MKKKKRKVGRNDQVNLILLISLIMLILIIGLTYFLNNYLDTVENVVGEVIYLHQQESTYGDSFISKCVKQSGKEGCINKLLRSPVLTVYFQESKDKYRYNLLHARVYKQIIGNVNEQMVGQAFFGGRSLIRNDVNIIRSARMTDATRTRSSRMTDATRTRSSIRTDTSRTRSSRMTDATRSRSSIRTDTSRTRSSIREKLVRKKRSISSLRRYISFVERVISSHSNNDQVIINNAINSGDKFITMIEKDTGRSISPHSFLAMMELQNLMIIVQGEKDDREDGPTRPEVGQGQGGGGNLDLSGGSSGSGILDCLKQSGPNSGNQGPEGGGIPGGPVATTTSGGIIIDPMTGLGPGTGIGGKGELICGAGGISNIESGGDEGITTDPDDDTTPADTNVDTSSIDSETTSTDQSFIEKYSVAPSSFTYDYLDKGKELAQSFSSSPLMVSYDFGTKMVWFKFSMSFYNPEPADTSSATEGFKIDCNDGSVFLCMFSNREGEGEGDCILTKLDVFGHPDPNSFEPCGDEGDTPADAINWPVDFLVDPVPYLQQVQLQMGESQQVGTPMLYQTFYLETNSDEASG